MDSVDDKGIISTHNLSLGYGTTSIVSTINLHILKGEFIGILGPNGSGKSTFLLSLLGLLKPLSGNIEVLGETPKQGSLKIGYMPQMRIQMSATNLTSRAILNATYYGMRYGMPFTSASQKLEIVKVLDMVEATTYADRPFHQLSGGERKRIYLAQALLGEPAILLLDEPLANLDPRYQEMFITLLQAIQRNTNVTILFTAHDPNPLLHILSRVIFFARGKAIMGAVDEIITSKTLSSLYETPIEVLHVKERLFVIGDGQNVFNVGMHNHD